MKRALIDTDILSEVLKQRSVAVAERSRAYLAEHGRLTLSAVTTMEISYGLHRVQRLGQLSAFETSLQSADVIDFDRSAALLAGKLQAGLVARGTPVDLADVMIAATAIQSGLPVVTGNTAHFAAIQKVAPELAFENWRS